MRLCRKRGIRKRITFLIIIIFFTTLFFTIVWKYNEDSAENIVDATPLYSTDLCTIMHENLLAVILVNSAAMNIKKRLLIRSTWANKFLCRALGINVVFLVSNSTNSAVEVSVEKEKADFGDILHFSLIESYHRMTEKIIGGIKWTLRQCPRALYVIKSDDDMFINVFQLASYLNSLKLQNSSNDFLCLVWKGLRVERNPRVRWYVSEEEYSHPTYPTCCSGSTYIMPFSVARTVVDQSTMIPYFWIEDVYITGIIARGSSMGHQQIGHFFGFVDYRYIDVIEGRIIFAHVSRNETVIKNWLWNEVLSFQKGINNSLVVRPETYIVEHVATLKLYYDDYGETG